MVRFPLADGSNMRDVSVGLPLFVAMLGCRGAVHAEVSACEKAIAGGAVCEAANTLSLDAMASRKVKALSCILYLFIGRRLSSRTARRLPGDNPLEPREIHSSEVLEGQPRSRIASPPVMVPYGDRQG